MRQIKLLALVVWFIPVINHKPSVVGMCRGVVGQATWEHAEWERDAAAENISSTIHGKKGR